MGAARLRSYPEIAPKSLFLYVSRSHTRYGFRADARAFQFSVNAIKNGTVFGMTKCDRKVRPAIFVNVQLTNLNFLVGSGGTWVFFGWVCAALDSKLAPRSKNKFS